MFGCGKFDEIKMLGYLDGARSGDEDRLIEEHLMECGPCLEEMADMNRIQTDTEKGVTAGLSLPQFITVFSGNRRGKNGWGILRAVVSAVSARWEPLAETRGDNGGRAVSFVTGDGQMTVRITPETSGKFWISFTGDRLAGRQVELVRKGGSLPVYSRVADANEVLVRGVGLGEYEAKIYNETVRINLRAEDAEEDNQG